MLRNRILVASVAGLSAAGLAGIGTAAIADSDVQDRGHRSVSAKIVDRDGDPVGTAKVITTRQGTRVEIRTSGLTPGWHGVHIHTVGKCEGDFTSSQGHLNPTDADHPDHAGDLPQMLVMKNGDSVLSFATDRFTARSLMDRDGSAFVVHSGPDNYANIPTRYIQSGPDAETLSAGDAGSRVACGVFTRG